MHGRILIITKKSRTFIEGDLFFVSRRLLSKARLPVTLCACVCVFQCVHVCLSLLVETELVTREVNLAFVVQISLQPLVLLQREHSVLRRRKTYVINYLFPLTLPSFI